MKRRQFLGALGGAAAAAAIANHREANDHAAVRRQTRGATGPGLHEALDV